MECLNLKGKTCPLPVLETKQLLEATAPEEVVILVDNDTSRENVTRFLESRGYEVSLSEEDGAFCLTAHLGATVTAETTRPKRVVVLIDGETMGRGNDELGTVLMKSFLHTLKELTPLPSKLIFVNSGVKLTTEGSDYLPVLEEIRGLGVEILSCGTCLDFFGLKNKLRAGRVTNMYDIVTSLAEADQSLKP